MVDNDVFNLVTTKDFNTWAPDNLKDLAREVLNEFHGMTGRGLLRLLRGRLAVGKRGF